MFRYFTPFLRSASPSLFSRSASSPSQPKKRSVTLLTGDGIGPEITNAVVGVFQAASVPILWERFEGSQITPDVMSSFARNAVALKGPTYVSLDSGPSSSASEYRRAYRLYAYVVPIRNFRGIKTLYHDTDIDMVVIRENTEGEYTGMEHMVVPGVVQSMKVITREASERIAHYAFDYAMSHGRKKVTAIHKANIQKLTDGLFLETARRVAREYPDIVFNDMIIDNCCMQLVMNPSQFDVMLTPNLYGTIVTNVASALVGGPGLLPGVNVGHNEAIFELGGRHVAMDIAGKNLANPIAMLLSSVAMLRYLAMDEYAERIEKAVFRVVEIKKIMTQDVGGSSTTKEFTQAVIDEIYNFRSFGSKF